MGDREKAKVPLWFVLEKQLHHFYCTDLSRDCDFLNCPCSAARRGACEVGDPDDAILFKTPGGQELPPCFLCPGQHEKLWGCSFD